MVIHIEHSVQLLEKIVADVVVLGQVGNFALHQLLCRFAQSGRNCFDRTESRTGVKLNI